MAYNANDSSRGLAHITELFAYFDIDSGDRARKCGGKFSGNLVEALRVVPAQTAAEFVKGFVLGCTEKLAESHPSYAYTSRPDIRDSTLKDLDIESIRLACVNVSSIPRAHGNNGLDKIGRKLGRMIVNTS